jgi:hypothetical protein
VFTLSQLYFYEIPICQVDAQVDLYLLNFVADQVTVIQKPAIGQSGRCQQGIVDPAAL